MSNFTRLSDDEAAAGPTSVRMRVIGRFEKFIFFSGDQVVYESDDYGISVDLLANKVKLVVRTSLNNNDLKILEAAGITLINIPYRRYYFPEDNIMDVFIHFLLTRVYKNKTVGVVFQGSTLTPFLVAIAMMTVGVHLEDSLAKMHQLGEEASQVQQRYLRRREYELRHRFVEMKSIKRSNVPFARAFNYMYDKIFR